MIIITLQWFYVLQCSLSKITFCKQLNLPDSVWQIGCTVKNLMQAFIYRYFTGITRSFPFNVTRLSYKHITPPGPRLTLGILSSSLKAAISFFFGSACFFISNGYNVPLSSISRSISFNPYRDKNTGEINNSPIVITLNDLYQKSWKRLRQLTVLIVSEHFLQS